MNLLYFSIALIIRERLFFGVTLFLGSLLLCYSFINFEILIYDELSKQISSFVKEFVFISKVSLILLYGLLSGTRIIHSISETGIMLAVGTSRVGVITIIVCKELVYLFFSIIIFFIITGSCSLISIFNFKEFWFVSLQTFFYALIGCLLVAIPLSIYVIFVDPYESIRKQK